MCHVSDQNYIVVDIFCLEYSKYPDVIDFNAIARGQENDPELKTSEK